MQRNRLPKFMLCYKPTGKRNIGCSRKTWIIYEQYICIYIFGMRVNGTSRISPKILIQEPEENQLI
jgi:hypothetical protein